MNFRCKSHGNLEAGMEDPTEGEAIRHADPERFRIQSLEKTAPPVSPRRWTVLAASFVSISLSIGLPFNMTTLYVEFQKEFGRSNSETSLVQAICNGTFFTSGILFGILVRKFSPRNVGIPAAAMASLGIGCSYFASHLEFVMITLGIITGGTSSAVYLAFMTSLEQHFDGKAKVIALSFSSFSGGFGSVIMTPLLDLLIAQYGWRGCLLVMSALFLNLIPCLAICKLRKTSSKHFPDSIVLNSGQNFLRKSVAPETVIDQPLQVIVIFKCLLKNKVFLLFVLGLSMAISCLNALIVSFITFFLFKGYSRDDGAFFYLIMNIGNACFRFIPGLCVSICNINSIYIPTIFSLIGTVVLVCFPFASNDAQFLILTLTFGISLGGLFCSLAVTTVKIVGSESYSTAMGFLHTCLGISHIALPPLVGYIQDTTGSYDVSFYVCAGALGCSTILLSTTLWLSKTQNMSIPTDTRACRSFYVNNKPTTQA